MVRNRPLAGLKALDVGCGGGLLSEVSVSGRRARPAAAAERFAWQDSTPRADVDYTCRVAGQSMYLIYAEEVCEKKN